MIAHAVYMKLVPGCIDLDGAWQQALCAYEGQAGLSDAFLMKPMGDGELVMVSLWDSAEHLEAALRGKLSRAEPVKGFATWLAEPTRIERYEVRSRS